ncbi:MAG: hypothetical protein KDA63_13000 [Planctomycetales bacterium]|nr:hypothetical protein [Planctomycetales bacterium]
MEARIACLVLAVLSTTSMAASYRTPNFVVSAPTAEFAKQVGDAAESCRHDLAEEWLGETLPQWAQPCPIEVTVGPHLGAGGATSFVFDRGEVFQWRMNIQGSHERILDSVLPHEVTHTVFATHFRQPLPRWADEGACTTVEHSSERSKQDRMLIEFLQTRRGIPFSRMFAMKEYPSDVMPLYSQGYSLAKFLIGHGGKRAFIKYIEDGLSTQQWIEATQRHYDFENLAQLQDNWLAWVASGSPALPDRGPTVAARDDVLLASATEPSQAASAQRDDEVLMRSQSPDAAATAAADLDTPLAAPQHSGRGVPAQFAATEATAENGSPFSHASARGDNVPGGDPGRVLLEWSLASPRREVYPPVPEATDYVAAVPSPGPTTAPNAPSQAGFAPSYARPSASMAGQRPTMLR